MTITLKHILYILFGLAFYFKAAAQEYIVQLQHFGLEEGLSHRNVHFCLQDRRGLMWFGTDYGLNRFDGYHFKWITKRKNGLQSNRVQNALLDQEGLLWLMYGSSMNLAKWSPFLEGIDIFNPLTDQVTPFADFFAEKTTFQVADFHSFTQKETGEIVLLTKQMQLLTYGTDGTFKVVDLAKKYDSITNFVWSAHGYFWMSILEKGQILLAAVNERGEEVHRLPLDAPVGCVLPYQTRDSRNVKWIATHPTGPYRFYENTASGAFVQNQEARLFEPLGLDFSYFDDIAGFLDAGPFLVFYSTAGFFIFDKSKKESKRLDGPKNKIAFANALYADDHGKIWICTQFGIYLINPRPNHFLQIFKNAGSGLNPVRGLGLDKNNALWVIKESEKNLYKFQLSPDKKRVLSSTEVNKISGQGPIPFDDIFYALGLDRGKSNVYSFHQNSFVKTEVTGTAYQKTRFSDPSVYTGNPWSYHEKGPDNIWLGTEKGYVGHWENGRFSYTRLVTDTSSFFSHVYQFIENGDDQFWVVSESGLFCIEQASLAVVERYWSGGKGRFHLPSDKLYHAHQEADGTFWLGTSGGGLIHFDTRTGQYQQFTKVDGLSNNVIYAVYPDRRGNLWLSSDYGIMRFDKATHQVKTYLEQDGISHNEFNRISHFQADDGTLFFGGLNGITAFHPDDFEVDSSAYSAPLVISGFQQFVGSEKQLMDKTAELISTGKIVMAPNDPFLRLEFGLLTYEDVGKQQYAYKIEGQDKNWVYQKENFIRLSRLPYGEHRLRIRGQGADGQWSANELAIRLVVRKPFYLRPWFLVLCAFVFLVSGPVFYRIRMSQLKRQKKHLEAEVALQTEEIRQQAEQLKSLGQLKSRFFANVSHELRTPLTLMISPLNSILKKESNRPAKEQRLLEFVHSNSKHLLKLVNEILDLSKLETGRLEVKEEAVNFHDFLQPLLAQFKSYGTSESVSLEFDYRAGHNLHLLLDTNKFEKIVHNFLSNAIKFSSLGGVVKLKVTEDNGCCIVSVTDHGPGIHPEDLPHIFDRFYQSKQADVPTQGGTGIGLSLASELAGLLGGKIWVESEMGKGSTFYFQFPKKAPDGERVTVNGSTWETSTESEIMENSFIGNDAKTEISSATPSIVHTPPSSAHRSSPTVLIVEDNPELRAYMQILLEEDYHVITAENGKVAWEILRDEGRGMRDNGRSIPHPSSLAPDLIISDLMMPVMDGFIFLDKVKASDTFRHLPFIMLTARADVRVKLRALRTGVDDYLTKPFVEEELMARIETLLNNLEERKAFFSSTGEEEASCEEPLMAAADLEWLEKLENVYLEHLNDSRLSVDFAAQKMLLSGRQFHRQLKKLTGLTPNQYLREIRLNQARQFIEAGQYQTIKETAQAVGFSDVPYFTKLFRERFGANPSDMLS